VLGKEYEMKFSKLPSIAILLLGFAGFLPQIPAQHLINKQAAGIPAAACAVTMDSMKVEGNVLYFYYVNASSQNLEGVQFDAAYFDKSHQPHHIEIWGDYNDSVRPGKYKFAALNISFLRSIGYTGLSLWPTKARFRDGSTWELDPKNSRCGVEQHGKLELVGTMPVTSMPSLLADEVRP